AQVVDPGSRASRDPARHPGRDGGRHPESHDRDAHAPARSHEDGDEVRGHFRRRQRPPRLLHHTAPGAPPRGLPELVPLITMPHATGSTDPSQLDKGGSVLSWATSPSPRPIPASTSLAAPALAALATGPLAIQGAPAASAA